MNRSASGFRVPLFIAHCSLLILLCAIPCFGQDRGKMSVYVPLPTGGTLDQQNYFLNAFKMELVGANYPSVDAKAESAFTLLLNITANPDFDSRLPPDDNTNQRYSLGVTLVRSADNVEIVSLGFPFDTTDSMSDWNLYLLYEVMANASVDDAVTAAAGDGAGGSTRGGGAGWDSGWRDKKLYIALGAGVDLGYFLRPETTLTDQGIIAPMGLVGLEWQFLNFLSLQADTRFHLLNDSRRYIFAPGAALTLRGVIKPDRLMLEPYAGAEFTAVLLPADLSAPWLWALCGLQLGFKGGSRWAITLDLTASWSALGEITLPNNRDYSMTRVSIVAGCKIGFFDRKK